MITSQSVRRQIRALEDFHTKSLDEEMFCAGAIVALEWALEGRQRFRPTSYLVMMPRKVGYTIRQIWSDTYGAEGAHIWQNTKRRWRKKKSAPPRPA